MSGERRSPDFWRAQAEEARQRAAAMNDPEAARTMHVVADLYERMAAISERTSTSGESAASRDAPDRRR